MTNKSTAVIETGNGTAISAAEWVIDCDMPMREKRAVSKQMREINANPEADESMIYPILAKFVKKWPFSGDPSNPEDYDNLTISQFKEVSRRFNEEFQRVAN